MNKILYKILIAFVLLTCSLSVHSQDQSHNYRRTVTYLENGRDSIVGVQYYDGLGRPDQKVVGGANASGIYLHSHTEYDGLGRADLMWLPVKGNQSPGYLSPSNIPSRSAAQYHDGIAYSDVTYDALDRTTFTTTPGAAWAGRGKRCVYRSNDSLEVRRYSAADLRGTTYYPPRCLYCTENWDEDSLRVQTFKDFLDRTILERRGIGEDISETYYVYNDLSQLAYVLSPQYQTNPNLSLYAYCYQYDTFGRISSRKLPGCEPITYEYDNADRVIRMQDGLLRAVSKHRVYTYDNLGRLTRQSIEGGMTEIINYYDRYDFLSSYESLNQESADGRVLGLQWYADNELYAMGNQTGLWQRASDGTALLTTFVYDKYGRVVKRSESGLGGTALVTEYTYNFVGDVTSEVTTHYSYDTEEGMLVSDYSLCHETRYDYHGTRLPSSAATILYDHVNGQNASEVEDVMVYDDYGQLLQRNRSGVSGDLCYSYDTIHGWLNGISCPTIGFNQRLYRETGGIIPRWNGSISSMTWQTEAGAERRYDYTYDSRNRLIDALYSQTNLSSGPTAGLGLIPSRPATPNYRATYDYDKNSNLTGLVRYGRRNDNTFGIIDNLNIAHNGNQLRNISDEVSTSLTYTGSSEFVDGSLGTGIAEYSYNGNGALTKDLNRNITGIEYDLLGNPTQITFTSGRTTSYVYSADGRKLRTTHRQGTRTPETINYNGPFEFRNGYIDRVSFSGGYYDYDHADEEWLCHYYITDYQGSVRMVVNQDAVAGAAPEQVTHYYPYGGVIGDISTNETLQKNKFEGKELDRTFGLDNYDIHARNYFAMAPIWDRIDKKAEDYYGISPYAYCGGDPVNFVDPDGMEPTMDEAGQMSLYMYGVFSLESISGGWNLVYQLQEQQDGYIAALFSRSHESTTEYAYVFRGTIGELDEKDWVTNLVEQPLGISTQFSKSMDDAMILNCRFPNNELTFVGHSKAGGQAEAAAIATSRSALTLNSSGISEVTRAEAVLLNTVGKIMGEIPILSNPEVKNYVTLFDPLNIATGALQFVPFVPRKSGDTFVLPRLVGHECANFVK